MPEGDTVYRAARLLDRSLSGHVLEHSDPPRDASHYNVTAAARDYHDRTGTWDVQDADPDLVEQVLAAHPADG